MSCTRGTRRITRRYGHTAIRRYILHHMAIPSLLFDLDGTLVDSVYQHVLAWREALEAAGLELSVWRIHRRIGMSGGLFLDALLRETGRRFGTQEAADVKIGRASC